MQLTKYDYLEILNYYKIPLKNDFTISYLKKMVEKIIAKKLCSCIKKVDNSKYKDETRPIAICTNSVVSKKNLKINKFTCKKRKRLIGDKNNKLTKQSNQTIKLKKKK